MTPAPRLRQAAQLARETAEGVSLRDWPQTEDWTPTLLWSDAAHIALWSPPVALAVAAWLEDVAERVEFRGFEEWRGNIIDSDGITHPEWKPALAVADALLAGERVP